MTTDARITAARTAYYTAQAGFTREVLAKIGDVAREFFPSATTLKVHGEYTEDNYLRLSAVAVLAGEQILADNDEHQTDEWDGMDDELNEWLMWLVTCEDEDWEGDDDIDVTERPHDPLVQHVNTIGLAEWRPELPPRFEVTGWTYGETWGGEQRVEMRCRIGDVEVWYCNQYEDENTRRVDRPRDADYLTSVLESDLGMDEELAEVTAEWVSGIYDEFRYTADRANRDAIHAGNDRAVAVINAAMARKPAAV